MVALQNNETRLPERERATAALKHRDFRLLWAGQFVSTVGTQMQIVALGWQMYLLTGSPLNLGILGLLRAVPMIAFALIGGTFADRRDRRRVLLITQTLLAAVSAVLAVATGTGTVSVGMIYVLTVISATVDVFDDPARQALIPNLVPRHRLAQAITLNIVAGNIAAVAGPALGGLAIAAFGLTTTYAIDAFSFVAVIVALLAMRERPQVPVPSQSSIQAVLEGLQFVRDNPVILSLMVLDFLATLFGASLVLLPIFASEILEVGANGLGLLYAAPAAGAVAGGLVMSVLPVSRRPGRMVILSVACYGIAVAIFGAAPNFTVALLALGASGVADTVSMTFRHTIRQLATPDELRGRIAAVHSIFAGGGPELGNFEAGLTARLFGTQPAVILGGVACVVIAIGVAAASPRIRNYRVDEPEPMLQAVGDD